MADIKKPVATLKSDVKAAVDAKVTAPEAEAKKEAAPAKKTAAKKAPAKKTATAKAAAKPAEKKAAKKAPAKKTAAKKAAVKETAMFALDEGQNVTADALMKQYLKSAKDRCKYDLGIKASELKAVDIYVNINDKMVYSVITKVDGETVNDQFPM